MQHRVLSVPSPDPYCPDPVVVSLAVGPDRTIVVSSTSLPSGSRRSRIRRLDALSVEITTRIVDRRGVSFDVVRGPIDLSSPVGWRSTGWAWSAIVADAIATLARSVWGDA
jgi:hypothetical protein